jgi:fluoroacetyl-CoA thioesterase
MKNTLAAGLETTREFVVDRDRTIDFMGEDARVYATPMLVRDIEVACRELLLGHLDPGEDSVGTRVELDHLAPSVLGARISIYAKAVEVKGRAVTFEINGKEGGDAICRGRHTRFVVDVEQTRQRLRRKQAQAA